MEPWPGFDSVESTAERVSLESAWTKAAAEESLREVLDRMPSLSLRQAYGLLLYATRETVTTYPDERALRRVVRRLMERGVVPVGYEPPVGR